jgi:hypothetical protein
VKVQPRSAKIEVVIIRVERPIRVLRASHPLPIEALFAKIDDSNTLHRRCKIEELSALGLLKVVALSGHSRLSRIELQPPCSDCDLRRRHGLTRDFSADHDFFYTSTSE